MQNMPTLEPSILSAFLGLTEQIKQQNEWLGLVVSQNAQMLDLLMADGEQDEGPQYQSLNG